MVTPSDAERVATMRAAIEDALKQAAAKPGVPAIRIDAWGRGEAEPELHVVVGEKSRVLEVSQAFLEDEPDSDALREVSVAASQLVEGNAPRVQLFHRGVFAAWRLSREPA